jgi:hypothetical protein
MKLFDEIERVYYGPANHNEKPFNYFQRSARKDISIIRNKLNEWFKEYPEAEKKSFKNSFKKQFDDCFFELFLFKFFQNLGFNILVHPKLERTTKRPDFLITKENLELYVEAKIVKDKSTQQENLERKMNQLYDDLNKIKINGFLLSVDELRIKTNRQPSTKAAVKHIENEIRNLDPEKLTENLRTSGFEKIPVIKFENELLLLIVKPIPAPDAGEEKNSKPIGIYPAEFFWGGGEESLKNSINIKANKYGKFDKPFIVCINALSIKTSGLSHIENAIWGSLALSWSENPHDPDEKLIRTPNGVFLDERGPRLKNLSGVFVTKAYPHNIPNAEYWFFENPFSTNFLDFKALGVPFNYVKDGKIHRASGNNFSEIFQIPHDWIDAEN